MYALQYTYVDASFGARLCNLNHHEYLSRYYSYING
jgi:hypothetical protein